MRTKAVLTLCLLPLAGQAESDLTALTTQERAAFHAEIRALLLDEPELVLPAFGPDPAEMANLQYADEIAEDLAMLAAHTDALFPKGEPMALFYDPAEMPDLPDQTRDLLGVALALHPLNAGDLANGNTPDAALARDLGLDMVPFFITPKVMIRGDMPLYLLPRYLND